MHRSKENIYFEVLTYQILGYLYDFKAQKLIKCTLMLKCILLLHFNQRLHYFSRLKNKYST